METEQTPEPSNVVLQRFFESSESARRASAHLKKTAEVGVRFTDVPGDFYFKLIDGQPRFMTGTAHDPDFELTLAPGAVNAIAAQPNADVAALGIPFFHPITPHDPPAHISFKLPRLLP